MNALKREQFILALFEKNELSPMLDKELCNFENITFTSLNDFTFNDPKSFDVVLSGTKSIDQYTKDLFAKVYNSIKPGGSFLIHHLTKDEVEKLEFLLKTNGFINVFNQKDEINGIMLYEIKSSKPSYDVGSSAKLNLAKPTNPVMWSVDDDDDDDEIIDPDNLLDEDDFKRPEQSSLRVCGTTGKRKACRDCSCGLAEELDTEATNKKPINSAEAKSSCGSCYLGDAFRCASCPYLGMPAFKPGEKVQLPETFLKADI